MVQLIFRLGRAPPASYQCGGTDELDGAHPEDINTRAGLELDLSFGPCSPS